MTPVLNVRSGPGREHADVGDLHQDDVISILSIAGKDVWAEIEPGKWAAFASRGRQYLRLV